MAAPNDEYIFSVPALESTDLKNFDGLATYIYNGCKKFSDNIAQIDSVSGTSETFGSLSARSIKLALALKDLGIQPGDMITGCSVNTSDVSVFTIGGWYLGALLSFLDPSLSQPTTVHLLNETRPKLVFCSSEALELIENSLKELDFLPIIVVLDETIAPYISFSCLMKQERDLGDFKPFKPESTKDTAIVMYSSGTTGLAKGICLHHYGLFYSIYLIKDYVLNGLIHFTSFYWISGIHTFLYTFLLGSTRVLVTGFDADTVLDVIYKYKVEYIVTAIINILYLKNKNCENYDLSCMKCVGVGGTPATSESLEFAEKIFPNAIIVQAFGMTEQCGPITIYNQNEEQYLNGSKRNSVGKIVPGVTCKIVDVVTEATLGPNQRGEFRFKSCSMMNGYYNRSSKEAWDEDGWLKTGDVAYFDEDGDFYIVDRIKDMLKFRSWHVTPSALEAVLMLHPLVREAVVVGIPHEVDGDLAVGVVTLQGTATQGIEDELVQFVADRVGFRDRLHGGVKVVSSIPRTPSGKSKKMEIKLMIQE